MRRFAFAVVLASVAALVPARAFQQSAPPQTSTAPRTPQAPQTPQTNDAQFRADVNLVSVYATVLDDKGDLIKDLKKDDFVVLDDGKPREVTEFSNDVQPITVVLMLDRSVSLAAKFPLERAAAEAFVANLVPGDRARIGSFNSMIRIDPGFFTGDRDELIRILHFDLLDAGLTPLWNATASAMNALESQKGRRIVLLVSDGHDNTGLPGRHTLTFDDVRDRAVTDDIMVYSVGITNPCGATAPAKGAGGGGAARFQQRGAPPPPGGTPDNGGNAPNRPPIPIHSPGNPNGMGVGTSMGPGIDFPLDALFGNHLKEGYCTGARPGSDLADLAYEGGGGYTEIHDGDDLPAVFARLADELHHQYLLGYTIDRLDGRTHSIEVRTRDAKQHVWARTRYVAAKQ